MKKIYLLLTFVLFQVLTKAQFDFIVAEEEGTLYINHRVMDQETLTDIASYYSLRQSALEKMNGISADKPLKVGQEIKIPLTETNYYKGFDSKNRPEYEALKYFIGSSENLQRIAQHLFVEERFLKNWNPQTGFRRGDLITVGWIKIVGMKPPVNISKPNEVNGQVSPIKKGIPVRGQSGQKTIKPAQTKMAQPRVVKNDPNRTAGKNSVNTPKRAQTPPVSTKQQAPKNNQLVETKNKPEQSEPKLEKEENTCAPAKQKKSLKERWNQLVNGETKKTSPEKKKNNSVSKPMVAKKEKLIEQSVEKQKEAVSENKQQENVPNEVAENKQQEMVDDPFAEAAAEIKKEKSLSSEVKQLKFNAQKIGKAAYFFSGPIGGKFYVVTNLVAKGELVKVVNTANGKFAIAEVIGTLPGNDLTKGLIFKISDNAKLPLGQKNSVFNVQIFY
ncbi:MAG: LysM peptidoglycan-binding domain-containing protein [Chitinophagaceae bacterium]|jgi:hypothetical protein